MKTLTFSLAVLTIALMAAVIAQAYQLKVLRERAQRLAAAQIVDGTTLVKKPAEEGLILTDGAISYAPYPKLTVESWSSGGVVGEGRSADYMQWSCPPGYNLKWDGGIPYCD